MAACPDCKSKTCKKAVKLAALKAESDERIRVLQEQIEAEREGVRVSGFAGLPTFNRGVADHQYLFVNGRPVKDRLLTGAVRGAALAHWATLHSDAGAVFDQALGAAERGGAFPELGARRHTDGRRLTALDTNRQHAAEAALHLPCGHRVADDLADLRDRDNRILDLSRAGGDSLAAFRAAAGATAAA